MNIHHVPNSPSASTTTAAYQPEFSNRIQHSKMLVAIVALLGVTVMALATALVVNRSEAQPGPAVSTPVQMVSALPVPVILPVPVTKLVSEAPKLVQPAVRHSAVQPAPALSPRASFCADCATVEAVTAVQRQGQVSGVAVGNQIIGLGTVAGGLIGGLLGNQVGGGNGKTLATVAGLAGGAFAGNTIEKNMKQITVYDVRLRMDDGSRRHMEVSSAVAVGSKVTIEGKNLRMANLPG